MEDNPYFKLAEMLKHQASSSKGDLTLGKVITAPDEDNPDRPLIVAVGGTLQEREDLLLNTELDPLGFAAGDQLLMLPIDEAQRYIIICKVVSA